VTGDSDKQLPRAIVAVTKNLPKVLGERINGHPSMKFLEYKTDTVLGDFITTWNFRKFDCRDASATNAKYECQDGGLNMPPQYDLETLLRLNAWTGNLVARRRLERL
jgi:hypothetical protein